MTLVNGVYLFSNSEIQDFKDCPRRWWLTWHRGLIPREQRVDGVRDTGTRIHAALASYYVPEGQTPANPIDTLALAQHEDVAKVLAAVGTDGDLDQMQVTIDKLATTFDLEHAMISGYMDWLQETGADSDLEVIAPETYVEADFVAINGQNTKLIGKMDARVRSLSTGHLRFIDHKTGEFPNLRLLRMNEQALHYHILEWISAPRGSQPCDGGIWNTLRRTKRTSKSKPPYYQRDVVDHNRYELDAYGQRLRIVIKQILRLGHQLENGSNPALTAYPRPSRDCIWKCEFFKICNMFDDGSRVEDAVESLYQVGDPLGHYQEQGKANDNE
jgi:RecB family exonuclease